MILQKINDDRIKRCGQLLDSSSSVKDCSLNKQVTSSTVASNFGTTYKYGIVGIEDNNFILGFFSIIPGKYEEAYYVGENFMGGGMRSFNVAIMDIDIIPKENIAFHNGLGQYCISHNPTALEDYIRSSKGMEFGSGQYPYKTIARKYSANESIELFKDKQIAIKSVKNERRKALKYTFGMEFETSCGYVPEHLCYKYGLIPLRDGSIRGIEYSTIVLNNDSGLSLLKEQIALLTQYTKFDKDCSLHMHLGGYPIEPIHIFVLDVLGHIIQDSLEQYVPHWTFSSENYKTSHKNYCNKLQRFNSFADLYHYASNGTNYLGSLQQPHPNDSGRNAKWNISVRYVWQNIVNMMFYRGCKTVEYRFLRPTYNFNKVVNWLYVFNGILQFAEIVSKALLKQYAGNALNTVTYNVVAEYLLNNYAISQSNADNLLIIMNTVYKPGPAGIMDELLEFFDALKFISSVQKDNDDYIGGIDHLDKIIYSNVLNE